MLVLGHTDDPFGVVYMTVFDELIWYINGMPNIVSSYWHPWLLEKLRDSHRYSKSDARLSEPLGPSSTHRHRGSDASNHSSK